MIIVKTKRKKYPYVVRPIQGHAFYVPSQHKFGNGFVDHHGCSLVAFYIALSFLGHPLSMSKLLKWSKKHLKIKSKIPIKQVYKGLKKLAPGATIIYRKKAKSQEVRVALARGYLVLLETRDPIHTNPLMWDDTKLCVRNFSDGEKKKVGVGNLVKKQCKNSKYRGCVFIHP